MLPQPIGFFALSLTSNCYRSIVETLPVSVLTFRLKRESGESPELPRSGKQERTLQIKHWFGHELGS